MTDKLTIKIDGDPKGFDSALKDVEKSTSKTGESLKNVAKGAAIGFAALLTGATAAVNEARKFEAIKTQFVALTGSVEQATKTMEDLKDVASSSPFAFEDIGNAARKLISLGVSTNDVKTKLQQLGDVATASGNSLEGITAIFGAISGDGELTAQKLQKLKEMSIPIGPALAQSMGVAESAVSQLAKEGKISFEQFEKAFSSLSESGGFAFESMAKQAQTADGVLGSIQTSASFFAAEMGEKLLPAIKEIGIQLLSFIDNLRKSDEFLNIVKGTISISSKIILGIAEAFEMLGTRIGAILGTMAEVITNVLNLNFKQAVEAFKENQKAFTEDALKIQQSYSDKSVAIDKSLYEEKDAAQIEADNKELLRLQNQQNLKLQMEEKEKQRKKAEFQNALTELNNTEIIKTEEELAKLQERIDAKTAQDEIAKLQELERQGKHDEAVLGAEELKNKKIIEFNKKRLDQEKQIQAANLQAASNFVMAGAAIAKEGSETQKDLQAINAIISTYTAATQALSSPPGPPFTIPLAASVTALGLANVARIKGAKFANGGIFKGGMPGIDSIPAVVQRNEIIAPTSSFDEVVEGTARQRGFVKEGEVSQGGTIRVILEPVGDLINFIEQKMIETKILNTNV